MSGPLVACMSGAVVALAVTTGLTIAIILLAAYTRRMDRLDAEDRE